MMSHHPCGLYEPSTSSILAHPCADETCRNLPEFSKLESQIQPIETDEPRLQTTPISHCQFALYGARIVTDQVARSSTSAEEDLRPLVAQTFAASAQPSCTKPFTCQQTSCATQLYFELHRQMNPVNGQPAGTLKTVGTVKVDNGTQKHSSQDAEGCHGNSHCTGVTGDWSPQPLRVALARLPSLPVCLVRLPNLRRADRQMYAIADLETMHAVSSTSSSQSASFLMSLGGDGDAVEVWTSNLDDISRLESGYLMKAQHAFAW